MEDVKLITHKDVQILRICYSGDMDLKKFGEIIESAKAIIIKQAPHSIRLLSLFGDVRFNNEMTAQFEDYVKFNTSYIYASAVVGVTGLKRVLYSAFSFISNRKIKICETEDEAKEYLATV